MMLKGFSKLDKQGIYSFLDKNNIDYKSYEHPALFSAGQMDGINIPDKDKIVKNLFLRDDKKKNYYLVVVPIDKRVNIKKLSANIGSRRLSFADEAALWDLLKLKAGSVTPLGVLNDEEKKVTVVFDACMQNRQIGIHPMENTATVFISFEDVLSIVQSHGNKTIVCSLDE
jgi:Ala-tRNA(Pro) deacylase